MMRTGTGRVGPALVAAKRAMILGVVWLALVGGPGEGLTAGDLVAGVLATTAATWLSLRLLPPAGPVRLWRLALMLPGFLWHSLLGGADVIWRACHPRLPLRPGWVNLRFRLSPGGRAALGGEFSLMPGTLVAGARGQDLLVHMLDTRQDVAAPMHREAQRLERALAPRREYSGRDRQGQEGQGGAGGHE